MQTFFFRGGAISLALAASCCITIRNGAIYHSAATGNPSRASEIRLYPLHGPGIAREIEKGGTFEGGTIFGAWPITSVLLTAFFCTRWGREVPVTTLDEDVMNVWPWTGDQVPVDLLKMNTNGDEARAQQNKAADIVTEYCTLPQLARWDSCRQQC